MASKNEKQNDENQSGDDQIRTIHEMITEALMGTIPSNIDSEYTNFNVTDHETQLLYNSNANEENSHLNLGKLYLQIQNLDFRLSRVEKMIAKRDNFGGNTVKKRVLTLSRSEYSGSNDPCFGVSSNSEVENPSSTGLTTINPILTSSNDILNLDNFQDSSSSYSLPSISSLRPNKIQRKDEIKAHYKNFCVISYSSFLRDLNWIIYVCLSWNARQSLQLNNYKKSLMPSLQYTLIYRSSTCYQRQKHEPIHVDLLMSFRF